MTKVVNAWRMAGTASPTRISDALQQLAVAKQLLVSGAAKEVPAELQEPIGKAIDAFGDCLRASPDVAVVNVTVRTFTDPGAAAGGGIAARGVMDSSVR